MSYKESQEQIDGLQQSLETILTAGYVDLATISGSYVPYENATRNVNLGTYALITDLLRAASNVGFCIKNSNGDLVAIFGDGNNRSISVNGNLQPYAHGIPDIGTIATALKLFNNVYALNGISVNPKVDTAPVAMLDVNINDTAKVGQLIVGKAGQTGNALEYRDSIGNLFCKVSSFGHFVWGGQKRVTTQFDKTSNTTLSTITGLSGNVEAGKSYTVRGRLFVNVGAALGGAKFTIAGTCTASYIRIGAVYKTNVGDSANIQTALGGFFASSSNASSYWVDYEGVITVANAGTLNVQFAQISSNATASSVLVGSTYILNQID